MSRQFLTYTLILGAGISGLMVKPARADGNAWSSPYLSADESDIKRLLADRTKFIQDNYQLPNAESSKILQSLNGLIAVQERYQREIVLTLDRLKLVITLVGTDTALTEPERKDKLTKFQQQYYRLLSKAPMSLQNVVKMTEAALSTEKITPAHERIQSKFSNASKISGIPFAVENLDALACGPIHPGQRPEIRLPEREVDPIAQAPKPAPPPPAQTPANRGPTRQPPTAATPTPKTTGSPTVIAPPVPAGAPVPPAPPTTQWPELVKGSADKFDFTSEQRTSAENVLKQSELRVDAHRKQNQAAYDEAAKLSNEDAKMKKLQELNKPVDSIYDQMQKRIESIASIEQRNRVAQKEKAPKN